MKTYAHNNRQPDLAAPAVVDPEDCHHYQRSCLERPCPGCSIDTRILKRPSRNIDELLKGLGGK